MYTIKSIKAREILDSRGNPTVETDLWLLDGSFGRAAVPSGASVGTKEAIELRDANKERYLGKGVLKAVANINTEISSKIIGSTFSSQAELDNLLITLDGTALKSNIGANAILSVSLAFAKAATQGRSLYRYIAEQHKNEKFLLPRPMLNILNGGVHADNKLDIQEFMLVPLNFNSSREAIRQGTEVFHNLKKLLKSKNYNTNVGDEGGFAPNIATAKEALDYIVEAMEQSGYKPGLDIAIALDAAASEFYHNKKYLIEEQSLDSDKIIKYYASLVANYPIISIEDPVSELDHHGWQAITEALGDKVQIVGDDVFVTNPAILKQGIQDGIGNSVLIKLNQIGTLTETLETIRIAQENNYNAIISHRSGETEDTTIAHLAVGSGAGQIKAGSPCRTDRVCKYNELFRIEEELNDRY